MRIVSGIYGGRRLEVPKGRDIRPTADKVRGAMMNALRGRMDFDGARVLDCFCGTGALGLEALSNGAAFVQFWDKSRESLALAKRNAQALGADDVAFQAQDACKIGQCFGGAFDLVFLDPPYHKGLVVPTLNALAEGGWLASDAICVVEAEKDFSAILPRSYRLLNQKTYGETVVLYLQYSA